MILGGLGKKTFTKLQKFSKRVFRTPEKIYFKIRKGLFFHLPCKIIKNPIFLMLRQGKNKSRTGFGGLFNTNIAV
jgi:hypothetical protein